MIGFWKLVMEYINNLTNLQRGNYFFKKGLYEDAILEYELSIKNNKEFSFICNKNIEITNKRINSSSVKKISGDAKRLFFNFLLNRGDRYFISELKSEISLNNIFISEPIDFTIYSIVKKGRGILRRKNNIVLICDDNFSEATIVSLASCLRSAGRIDNIFIVAIDCLESISEKLRYIEPVDTNINIISVRNIFTEVESYKGLVTSAALFKFLLPYLLSDCDSALYIDSDVLALNRLDYIFSRELSGTYAYVIEDFVGTSIHNEHKRLGNNNYFNSGVMYLNLGMMRQEKLPEKMIQLKLENKNIKYMDQDVFNICFEENVMYMDGYHNFMTTNDRLTKDIFEENFPDHSDDKIKLIHYTYKKPWNEGAISRAKYWYEEYRSIFKKINPIYKYSSKAKTDQWVENFFNTLVRNNSVLLVEAADCHGEVMPGFVVKFREMGFFVDVLFTNNNYNLNSLSRIHDPSVRVFNNDKYSMYKFLQKKILDKYEFIIFTSRTLYYSIGDLKTPSIFEYFKVLENFRSKVFSLEHHLEYVNSSTPSSDYFFVLANPSCKNYFSNKVVNFPNFGNVKITPKNNITTFIVVGNIEVERKNHKLLLDTLIELYYKKEGFKLIIVARRGEIELPDFLKNNIEIYINASYDKLYELMELSDFILPMLDPNIEDHKRYLTNGTSGTFQLSYGFAKPCIINSIFAATYGYDKTNSIIYEDNYSFSNSLSRAISINREEYKEMQDNLLNLTNSIMKESTENLEKIVNRIGK